MVNDNTQLRTKWAASTGKKELTSRSCMQQKMYRVSPSKILRT